MSGAPAAAGAAAAPKRGNPLEFQLNIKQNASEISSYVSDLNAWSSQVKQKDAALREGKLTITKQAANPPPIRGSTGAPSSSSASSSGSGSSSSGSSSKVLLPSSASADQARFEAEKEAGNAAFASSDFSRALTHYSQCMLLLPSNPIGPSNRSQALLKLRRFHEAEADASLALSLDAKHVKSLYRRAQARKELRKFPAALEDCASILALEPKNKAAATLKEECGVLLAKQAAARAALTQPVVSSSSATNAAPAAATAAAAAPRSAAASSTAAPAAAAAPSSGGTRRMIIEEDDDDDDEGAAAAPAAAPAPAPAAAAPEKKQAANSAAPSSSSSSSAAAAPPAASSAAAAPASSSSATAAAAEPAVSSPDAFLLSSLRPPRNAHDFDSTFRTIRHSPSLIAAYLRLIPTAAEYGSVMKTAINGGVIQAILAACTATFLRRPPLTDNAALCYRVLHGMTLVPRFGLAIKMLEARDRAQCKDIIAWLREIAAVASSPSAPAPASEQELQQLAAQYQL